MGFNSKNSTKHRMGKDGKEGTLEAKLEKETELEWLG
jgi:hypothetical protein